MRSTRRTSWPRTPSGSPPGSATGLPARKPTAGRFTAEQAEWLELIRDHIAANLAIDLDDFDMVPFNQRGGLGKVYALFGEDLEPLLDELNEVLAA